MNEEGKEDKKELVEKLTEMMISMEGQSHTALIDSFNPSYSGLVKEFSDQIIKEYNCNTGLEKALAETIANSYIRIIDNSKRLNDCLEVAKFVDDRYTKYMAMLSKQIDRGNRQFLSGIIALKQLKAPALEVNIKTKNAFIAHNQQINSDYKPEPTEKENNEPK